MHLLGIKHLHSKYQENTGHFFRTLNDVSWTVNYSEITITADDGKKQVLCMLMA